MLMKKLVLIISVLLISFSVSAQSLTVLHMNDTHSHIEPERSGEYQGKGGVIEQAAYIDSVRWADGEANVLLLHAGDFGQGSSYFTELSGDIEIDIINAMDFDAVCIGNHEFDNGIEELARRLGNIQVPVICANYDFSQTPLAGLIKPYVIAEKAGRKVGIIGLLTDVAVVVDARIAAMLQYQDAAVVLNEYAAQLKNEGCDLVIALTHLGYEGGVDTDVELAQVSKNVDVIVGGHSHTHLDEMTKVKNAEGKQVIVVSDGKWGLEIANLKVK